MRPAPLPANEAERLAALRRYQVLDTPAEAEFDDLAWLASHICSTPIALISLVDRTRQWFKSRIGLEVSQTPRGLAFCAYAIHGNDIMEVPNALADERFHDNPLVTGAPGVRFYAGTPLTTPDGYNLGTLCVIDRQPRRLMPGQRKTLARLGRLAAHQLELRLSRLQLQEQLALRKLAEEAERLRAAHAALQAEVGLALTEQPVLRDVLQRCAEAIVKHLDAALARVWTLNHAENVLELQASAGLYTHLDGPHSRVPVGQLKIGLIASERTPHLTNQVVGDPRVGDQEWARREGMVAFAGYPLIVDGRVEGVLAMFARQTLPASTMDALGALAHAVALGIVRMRAEAVVYERQARIRAIVDNAGEGIITIDAHGIVESMNAAAQTIFGYAPEEVIGRNVNMLMPSPYRPEHDEGLSNYARTGQANIIGIGREVEGQRKDGSIFPMELVLSEVRLADQQLFTGFVRDISERKKSERTLAQAQERLQFVLGSAPGVIYTCSAQPPYGATFISESVRQQMGYEPRQFVEEPQFWARNIHPEDAPRVFDELARLFEDGHHTHEYRFRVAKGAYRWMRDDFRLIRDENGAPLEIIGSWTDINDRKLLEQLRADFAAMLAHDIRNPLAVICDAAELLLESARLTAEERELVLYSERNAQVALSLATNFVQASQIEAGQLALTNQPVTLNELLERVCREYKAMCTNRRITLESYLRPNLPLVDADAQALERAFSNLVQNAIKFTPEEGRITIESRQDGPNVVVSVADTGPGIAPEELATLFVPYQQTSQGRARGGTGLGLFIVKSLVEAHGGTVRVASTLGSGSCFTVLLPTR